MNRYTYRCADSLTKPERAKIGKIVHRAISGFSGGIGFNNDFTEIHLSTISPLLNGEKKRLLAALARWENPDAYWRRKWRQANENTDETQRRLAREKIIAERLNLQDETLPL